MVMTMVARTRGLPLTTQKKKGYLFVRNYVIRNLGDLVYTHTCMYTQANPTASPA